MKVAIILSGCGNRDGSELQETLSLFLALDRRNIEYQCFAPHTTLKVVNHLTGEEPGEERDLFMEAARIARGNLLNLSDYLTEDYDALALPGGMGAARNLSNYAEAEAQMTVLPLVAQAITDTYNAGRPIMAMCIAPMVLAKVLGPFGVILTLGGDNPAAACARTLGARTMTCNPTDVCIDTKNKVVTTPAYMAATRISEIFEGADNMVEGMLRLM